LVGAGRGAVQQVAALLEVAARQRHQAIERVVATGSGGARLWGDGAGSPVVQARRRPGSGGGGVLRRWRRQWPSAATAATGAVAGWGGCRRHLARSAVAAATELSCGARTSRSDASAAGERRVRRPSAMAMPARQRFWPAARAGGDFGRWQRRSCDVMWRLGRWHSIRGCQWRGGCPPAAFWGVLGDCWR
jgi:hypothetical protein